MDTRRRVWLSFGQCPDLPVTRGRGFACRALARWGLAGPVRRMAPDLCEDVLMVTAELLANACVHGHGVREEIEGFRLFGCLLHYAGHPVSAEFWWKIGAGAGDHPSAWCLYLHHLGRGEIREARLWFEQAVSVNGDLGPGVPPPAVPQVPDYFRTAPIAMDTRVAEPPAASDVLADEVDRLVMHTGDDTDGLVPYPDRRLADRVEEFAGLR